MRARFLEFVPGLVVGLAAGFGGYLVVMYLSTKGYWVPILPGACAGLACGQVSPVPSRRRGVVLALLTLVLVVFTEWKMFIPNFDYDGSFLDFARHVPQLSTIHLVFMAINGAIAYWWGREQGISFARRYVPGKPIAPESDADLT